MKKIIILTFFTLFTSNLLAETGKFNASGMGSWEMNVMNAGNGNMSITYDGNAGLSDKENGSIFDKSTMHCIGGLTLTAGKFDDETGKDFWQTFFEPGRTCSNSYIGASDTPQCFKRFNGTPMRR